MQDLGNLSQKELIAVVEQLRAELAAAKQNSPVRTQSSPACVEDSTFDLAKELVDIWTKEGIGDWKPRTDPVPYVRQKIIGAYRFIAACPGLRPANGYRLWSAVEDIDAKLLLAQMRSGGDPWKSRPRLKYLIVSD